MSIYLVYCFTLFKSVIEDICIYVVYALRCLIKVNHNCGKTFCFNFAVNFSYALLAVAKRWRRGKNTAATEQEEAGGGRGRK